MPQSVAVPPGFFRVGAEGFDADHITSIRHLELVNATPALPLDFVLLATLGVDQEEGGLHGAFRVLFHDGEREGRFRGRAEWIGAGLLVPPVLVPSRTKIDDAWVHILVLATAVHRNVLWFRPEGPGDEQRIPAAETGDLRLQGVEVRSVGRCVSGPRAPLLQGPITGCHLCRILESQVGRKEFLALRMMPTHDAACVLERATR